MAITSGFFNAVDGDRAYNAETISSMFEGLISEGVYDNVGGSLQVIANSGLNVQVRTGRARIGGYWVKLDAAETITIPTPHVTLKRYTAVCLRVDYNARSISIITVNGTPATTPVKPLPIRNNLYYDMILAYVLVMPNAQSITDVDIEDTRPDTSVCGIVSTLIQTLDTSTLYAQYTAAYAEQLVKMEQWFATQKATYDAWFEELTEELTVETYIDASTENYTTTGNERYIDLPAELTYTANDVLLVFLNGVNLAHNIDYTMQINDVTGDYMIVLPQNIAAGNTITFTLIKSRIGQRA